MSQRPPGCAPTF